MNNQYSLAEKSTGLFYASRLHTPRLVNESLLLVHYVFEIVPRQIEQSSLSVGKILTGAAIV